MTSIDARNIGVRRTWQRLIDGHCGISSIKDRSPQFAVLPSQVAAIVPEGSKEDGMWNATEHLGAGVCSSEVFLRNAAKLCRINGGWHGSHSMLWSRLRRR